MPTITRQHTFVRYRGAATLPVAGQGWLSAVLRVWSPSHEAGGSMQSFSVAANGGTLTHFHPGDSYWIHSSGLNPDWEIPQEFEILFGTDYALDNPAVIDTVYASEVFPDSYFPIQQIL